MRALGFGQDELERAVEYHVDQDLADLQRHLDEAGVRAVARPLANSARWQPQLTDSLQGRPGRVGTSQRCCRLATGP